MDKSDDKGKGSVCSVCGKEFMKGLSKEVCDKCFDKDYPNAQFKNK